MAKKSSAEIAQQEAEIIGRLDIIAEYRAMGVVFAAERPRSSGMIECYARGRDEKKPSAVVNCNTGRYFDAGSAENLSLWDFAAKYAGSFADWRDARKHFADKAGIKLGGGKPAENPLDSLEFVDWTAGYDTLAARWCRVHKVGASLEAVKLAGGRIGRYPCRIDKKSGERTKGEFTVVALPAYGEKLLAADPPAWVLWNISGHPLPVWRGKDTPPELVKMKSVGPTRGTMMNLHALQVLADERAAGITAIYKTGGPSDLLAILAAILRDRPDLLDKHLVLTNASSETGDVLPHQVALFAGHPAIVVHDADEAGEAGTVKWRNALLGVSSDLRCLRLPYQVQKKSGKDARDFLNGVPSDICAAS